MPPNQQFSTSWSLENLSTKNAWTIWPSGIGFFEVLGLGDGSTLFQWLFAWFPFLGGRSVIYTYIYIYNHPNWIHILNHPTAIWGFPQLVGSPNKPTGFSYFQNDQPLGCEMGGNPPFKETPTYSPNGVHHLGHLGWSSSIRGGLPPSPRERPLWGPDLHGSRIISWLPFEQWKKKHLFFFGLGYFLGGWNPTQL